jgi:hypothetical protein
MLTEPTGPTQVTGSLDDDGPRYAGQRYGLATSMNAGYQAGRGTESPGLEAQNQRWSQLTSAAVNRGTGMVSQAPTSVLQARSLSANGMSQQQAQNRMLNGEMMQNVNGMSPGTQENYNLNRMVGGTG